MDISESIDQILRTGDLMSGRFYERFFTECPHLKAFFANVNMERQATMLTSAIVLVEMYYSKDADGLTPYLKLLGKQHEDRGIAREDFDDWTKSMIRTLEQFHGEHWNAELEAQWREAIGTSVKMMLQGYEE